MCQIDTGKNMSRCWTLLVLLANLRSSLLWQFHHVLQGELCSTVWKVKIVASIVPPLAKLYVNWNKVDFWKKNIKINKASNKQHFEQSHQDLVSKIRISTLGELLKCGI